jgi:hypothetical protein
MYWSRVSFFKVTRNYLELFIVVFLSCLDAGTWSFSKRRHFGSHTPVGVSKNFSLYNNSGFHPKFATNIKKSRVESVSTASMTQILQFGQSTVYPLYYTFFEL